jgi:hypothetical protein
VPKDTPTTRNVELASSTTSLAPLKLDLYAQPLARRLNVELGKLNIELRQTLIAMYESYDDTMVKTQYRDRRRQSSTSDASR